MEATDSPDLSSYDYVIMAFSGGKDSLACLLYLLDCGVPKHKIELWHHLIDGREGSTLMDWPVTEDYCRKVAEAMDLAIKFSWKQGGFEREMLRKEQRTAPISFEDENDNLIECGGKSGKLGTRLKFPQVSGDLRVRWCSAYLKIDVCTAAINNQPRFRGKRTLVISGERAEESPGRAKYSTFEPDRAHRMGKRVQRHVDHWRPVHKWTEKQVWDIISRYRINPHPAYRLGWGRLSCMSCIFGSDSQWASVKAIAEDKFNTISGYEKDFGVTIHRTKSVDERAMCKAYPTLDPELVKLGLSEEYYDDVFVEEWVEPAGAYGESAGPT
jgi:3'-phosphoadenosine 5'-phosphosulfate sulfotransferase (PAPS reductase)/FAD synthetase